MTPGPSTAVSVDRYLERIGYAGSRRPTAETLRAIHRAHMLAVPFETLDCRPGRPVTVDPLAATDKIVSRRRGGFCFELNGAFAELLRALGFDVALLAARPGIGSAPPFSHLVLLVTLGERWLADVGFGDSFLEPLSLDGPRVQVREQDRRYELTRRFDEWTMRQLDSAEEEGYTFTLTARTHEDFAERCLYYSGSPESNFVRRPVCSLALPDGRVTLTEGRLITTRSGHRSDEPVPADARPQVLSDVFGIVVPATREV
jgi:N-hydroxyarylamine O-acetyltransferase